ncbi:purine-binding chemotaxis protein CheW [Geobacillus sp. 44B]|uniref:chemotaxis protein CheW n=1 Tax=Saccharococcus caldoxylosilyticus TaxID=81408 RepID=UPI0009BD3B9F|nr:chemotaxis protein CheW [Parageobacillus caldoxylosilyticus]OQP04426.1 chemotaxis protein CheW [Geobacillus sp. 44B]QNU36524.1 purine-binding chemotaxis protein CheW [Geobacillus sp. 44B]QXJ39702.1 Chemotaxis protein CheW [Parageobacillus caldoxylosilyticus]BDG36695.1 chemotaxis protein CheW [Parageobacillus caldoxylosilyticus]BDG40483.1 chemotaxis protein CheW [Parageobacillus caldoxylosilyticus]
MNKFVVFQLEREQYAVPIEYVISIEKMVEPTIIPQMPDYMVGVVRIRGELVPVLDTRKLLYERPFEETDKTRLVVTMAKDISVAFIVDEAKEILDIPEEAVKQVNMLAYQQTPYLVGVASLPERLIILMDPNRLFAHLEEADEIKEHIHSHQ